MKKNCNKIKHTCGSIVFADCTSYQTDLPEFSELECPSIEETTEELYNLVGEIKEETDLKDLGDKCLEYVETEEGKIIVKNVLLKFEEEICNLKEELETVKNRPLCEMPLGDCVDTKCLVDACNENISTVGQLLQALVDINCETP